jgi:hypothetical protein
MHNDSRTAEMLQHKIDEELRHEMDEEARRSVVQTGLSEESARKLQAEYDRESVMQPDQWSFQGESPPTGQGWMKSKSQLKRQRKKAREAEANQRSRPAWSAQPIRDRLQKLINEYTGDELARRMEHEISLDRLHFSSNGYTRDEIVALNTTRFDTVGSAKSASSDIPEIGESARSAKSAKSARSAISAPSATSYQLTTGSAKSATSDIPEIGESAKSAKSAKSARSAESAPSATSDQLTVRVSLIQQSTEPSRAQQSAISNQRGAATSVGMSSGQVPIGPVEAAQLHTEAFGRVQDEARAITEEREEKVTLLIRRQRK